MEEVEGSMETGDWRLMEESRWVKKDTNAPMSHQIQGDMQLEISIQGGVHRN